MRKIILLFICAVFSLSCLETRENNFKNSESDQKFSEGIAVQTMIIKPQDFKNQIVSNGKIEAQTQSELRFKTGEQIVKIYVRNGEKVQKGDLIAKLDNELLKNQWERAIINFDNSKREVLNQKILYGVKDLAEEEIDADVLEAIYQKAGFKSAKNALENAEIFYNTTILRAPFSGLIANLILKEGNFVNPSDNFCTLISYEELDVTFHVLESHLQSLKLNMEVKITPFSFRELSYKGEITEINPIVNEYGLTKVKAKILLPDPMIFDGMNVKVFVNDILPGVTVIPKEALVIRDNREVVFTIKKGVAQWNYVEILAENSSNYAIEPAVKSGLQEGDSIITSGNLNLSQNSKVFTDLPN